MSGVEVEVVDGLARGRIHRHCYARKIRVDVSWWPRKLLAVFGLLSRKYIWGEVNDHPIPERLNIPFVEGGSRPIFIKDGVDHDPLFPTFGSITYRLDYWLLQYKVERRRLRCPWERLR